jgi:hypothetical protein
VKLGRPVKLLIGALTLWPFVYLVLFFAFSFASFFIMAGHAGGAEASHSAGAPIAFAVLFIAHLGTMLMMLALIAFYIVYLFKTDRVRQDKKALWAVVLFLGNMLAIPVFFWIYVWPDQWPRTAERDTPRA